MRRLSRPQRRRKSEQEPPLRLPICGLAIRDPRRRRLLHELVYERAERSARRHNLDRREFLESSCGMATTLFALNLLNGCARSDGRDPQPSATAAPSRFQPLPTRAPQAGVMNTAAVDDAGLVAPTMAAMGDAGADDGGYRTTDGGYAMPEAACEDEALAGLLLGIGEDAGHELIIDMQMHFATPETGPLGPSIFQQTYVEPITQERFPWLVRSPGVAGSGKYDRFEFVQQVLLGSPTSIAALSGTPYTLGVDGTGAASYSALTNEDLHGGLIYLNDMFPGRVVGQALVMPNDRIDVQLAAMESNAAWCHAWRTDQRYAPASASTPGTGYRLDEGVGPRMLQKGVDLGRPIFSITKGATPIGFSAGSSTAADVGPAARMFPEARLIISECAFELGLQMPESSRPSDMPPYTECGELQLGPGMWAEGAYDERDPSLPLDRGLNALIHSLRSHNIGPNGRELNDPSGPVTTHVYAEVGTAWPQLMTSRHEEAMHFWGKLLKHIGEDRILWGTASIWYGSPTPIIAAFRCFEISTDFQARFGYPALTAARKRKILGLNAARLGWLPDACHASLETDELSGLRRQRDLELAPRRHVIAHASRLSRRRLLVPG